MEVFTLVLVLCLYTVGSEATDPCSTYENLIADSTRSPSHLEPVYENKNCDITLSEKWYRLSGDAGTDLTNDSSVLVSDGCGTLNQLWMNGDIPDVSDEIVDREICLRSPFSNCHSSFTVQVKNCCSFRVYNLKSSNNCPAAYCVSPSSVPSVDCPTTTSTTAGTTTTSETTTTTSTTISTTAQTTAKMSTTTSTTKQKTKPISGDKHVTIVNTVSKEIIIAVVVLLVIIAAVLVGTVVYKSLKCSKVDTERQLTYETPVHYCQSNNCMDIYNQPQAVEKGGLNNCAPVSTRLT